jgi:tetratricopeptide (TPR) repeat protein
MRPALALAAIVALLYLPTLGVPFVYDDRIEVLYNRTIHDVGQWRAVATYNFSRPLLIFSYAANWAVGGDAPLGFHVVNVALHALNTVLAWRLLSRIVDRERALWATAFWALHPMCTEAVTYVTGRSDALVSAFILVAVAAAIDDARSPGRAWRTVLVGCGGAAVSKETAAALPILVVGAELFLVAGGRWRLVRWRRWAPLAVMVLAALAVRTAVYGWPRQEVARTWSDHVLGQAEVWARILRLWLLPWGQSIFHDWPAEARPAGALALAAWVGVGAWCLARRGVWAFAFLLWAAPMAVASAVPMKETGAEHRTYLAGVGLALLAGHLPLQRRMGGRWIWAIPLVFAGLTVLRNHAWRTEVAIWTAATEVNPTSAPAWYARGDAHRLAGESEGALAAYARAGELDPEHVDARLNTAIVQAEAGQFDAARASLREVLRRDPGNCGAMANLAGLSLAEGDRADARRRYEGALRLCPRDPAALWGAAVLAQEAGDSARAVEMFRAFLAVIPHGQRAMEARARLQAMGAE